MKPVDVSDGLSLEAFQERAFRAEQPLLIRGGGGSVGGSGDMPASRLWFVPATAQEGEQQPESSGSGGARMRLAPYLEQFAMEVLPFELMYPPQPAARSSSDRERHGDALSAFATWLAGCGGIRPGLAELLTHHVPSLPPSPPSPLDQKLIRMEAPLGLLLAADEYNNGNADHRRRLTQLYIAQASIADLPAALQRDVPAPALVRRAGRGDVYDASLWLGLEPTYTPWHRDPNPNLFCQLCSRKTVRLMPPAAGERIFQQVRTALLRQQRQSWAAACAGAPPSPSPPSSSSPSSSSPVSWLVSSSSRIRGEEMMQGPERQGLHDAVWDGEYGDGCTETTASTMQEAHLDPGDALFIPKGWWHSVKSAHADGRLNGSVNWWFR